MVRSHVSRSCRDPAKVACATRRSVSRRYLLALSLIAGLTIVSTALISLLVERQERYAEVINVAGRQRMAALVGPDRVQDTPALSLAADAMLEAHWRLRRAPAHMSPALVQAYFAPVTGLDQRIETFVRKAAGLTAGRVDPEVARQFRQEALGPMLDSLQNAVEPRGWRRDSGWS